MDRRRIVNTDAPTKYYAWVNLHFFYFLFTSNRSKICRTTIIMYYTDERYEFSCVLVVFSSYVLLVCISHTNVLNNAISLYVIFIFIFDE